MFADEAGELAFHPQKQSLLDERVGFEESIGGAKASSPLPLPQRYSRTNRRPVESQADAMLSQVIAACPVFPKGVQTHRHRFRSLRPSTAGSLSDPFWAGLHHVYKRAA